MAGVEENRSSSTGSYEEKLRAALKRTRSGETETTEVPSTQLDSNLDNGDQGNTFGDIFDDKSQPSKISDDHANQGPSIINNALTTSAKINKPKIEVQDGEGAEAQAYDAQGRPLSAEQVAENNRIVEQERLTLSPALKRIEAKATEEVAAKAKAREQARAAKAAEKAANPGQTPEEIAAKKALERQRKLYEMAKQNPGLLMN